MKNHGNKKWHGHKRLHTHKQNREQLQELSEQCVYLIKPKRGENGL